MLSMSLKARSAGPLFRVALLIPKWFHLRWLPMTKMSDTQSLLLLNIWYLRTVTSRSSFPKRSLYQTIHSRKVRAEVLKHPHLALIRSHVSLKMAPLFLIRYDWGTQWRLTTLRWRFSMLSEEAMSKVVRNTPLYFPVSQTLSKPFHLCRSSSVPMTSEVA